MFDPLQIPNVWRAQSMCARRESVVSSGFDELDIALGGGWPASSLIEVLTDDYGIGELTVLLPLLRVAGPGQSLTIWLNPPYSPNLVGLSQHRASSKAWMARSLSERDVLWSMEQALRSRSCTAVLGWVKSPSTATLRRLKLAAQERSGPAILFRPRLQAQQPSPALVRVSLTSANGVLRVSVLKAPGRKSTVVELAPWG